MQNFALHFLKFVKTALKTEICDARHKEHHFITTSGSFGIEKKLIFGRV